MPRDFTLHVFKQLLLALKEQRYTFQTFAEFLKSPAERVVILRHDVDARKLNSLQIAKLEAKLGITGTFFFRIVPQSFDAEVIRQIAELGHEIGYHYEDLALEKGNRDKAMQLFEQHLAKLRQVVPIDTICMHGSPLSRYDNRKMWENFNYRNYGIIGEPYFDVDFNQVKYLTDTGRRWDGEKVSIRDKVVTRDKGQGTSGMGREDGVVKGQVHPPSLNLPSRQAGLRRDNPPSLKLRRVKGEEDLIPQKQSFHSTFDIINAAKAGTLPAQLMINVHPQRWDNRLLPWIKEMFWQRVKNEVKGVITR